MKHTIEGQIQILSHAITLIEASNIPDELKKSMGDGLRDSQETLSHQSGRINALEQALNIMTSLCRIKYGNLDKDVYAEIDKAENLLNK